jgi:hypothetical protein
VVVHGQSGTGNPIHEETLTTVVNAHGALIDLSARVEVGQLIELEHRETGEKQQCRVIHVGPKQREKAPVGIEFTIPAPRFWQIDFPPESWNAPQNAVKSAS